MAKPFTPEQREELKTRIVELVHQDGRVTIRQLSDETGISRASVGRLCIELVASGDVYNSGYGLFRLNRLARTGKAPAKNSRE